MKRQVIAIMFASLLAATFSQSSHAKDLSSDTATAADSTTSRTLANRFADVVSVKDFGAVGDGSTDDTAAIQAAVAAINSAGGGVLFFPCGTYSVEFTGSPAAYTFLFPLTSHTRVQMARGAKIVPVAPSSDFCAVFGPDKTALPVTDLEFVGLTISNPLPATQGTYPPSAIQLATNIGAAADSVTDVKITRCNFDAANIYILQRTSSGSETRQVRKVKITDCVATNVTGSAVTADGMDIEITNLSAEGTTVEGENTWDAVSIHSGLDVRVLGGRFSGFSGSGNAVNIRNNVNSRCGSKNILIEGVTFQNNDPVNGTQIYISSDGSSGSGEDTYGVSNVTIRGCQFREGGLMVAILYGGDAVVPFNGIVIDGNIGRNVTWGIWAHSWPSAPLINRLTISNNNIEIAAGNDTSGIYADYVDHLVVTGNNVNHLDTDATAPFYFDNISWGTISGNNLASQNTDTSNVVSFTNLSNVAVVGNNICGEYIFTTANNYNEVSANVFDSVGTVDGRTMVVGWGLSSDLLRTWAAAAPTTGMWKVGDRVYNSVPSVGQPKSWVCTVAGTPGTWTSEGNL